SEDPASGGWSMPTLDRVPGLRHIWGAHRLPGLAWVGDLRRETLLRAGAVANVIAGIGIVLAIALQSVPALVVGLLSALVVLGLVAELTPGPGAERPASSGPKAPLSSRPARPARVRPERPAAPTQSSMTNDLKLRHNVALTKLAAALIARGRRAHPFTTVA